MKKFLSLFAAVAIAVFAKAAVNDVQLSQVVSLGPPIRSTPVQVPMESAITTTLASWRSAQGLGTEDSPGFTNTTLTGYIQLAEQAAPGTPTNAGRIYFDTSNRLSWKGENGFVRTFDGTANSADRAYVLPNFAGTVALIGASTQTGVFTATSFNGLNAQTITGNSSGAWAITTNGTSQDITATTTGTGKFNIVGANAGTSDALLTIFDSAVTSTDRVSAYFGQSNATDLGGFLGYTHNSTAANRTVGLGFIGRPTRVTIWQPGFVGITGNLLLTGLTTDTAGALQLASHTTAAGGIAFFTDTILYRSAAGNLRMDQSQAGQTGFVAGNVNTGGTAGFDALNNGTSLTRFGVGGSSGAGVYTNYGFISTANTLTGFEVVTNSGTVALTVDNSQNTTAVGYVSGGTGFRTASGAYNAQTGTTYTLLAADNGKIVTLSNASAITLTVPSGLGAGFSCSIIQLGAGQVTVTASSTTINNPYGNTKLSGQYAQGTLTAYVANTFVFSGDTAP